MLAVRHKVLALDATFTLHNNGSLAPSFFAKQFYDAIDLRHDRRVFRLARLEDFCDAGQTASDVLRARHFTRRFGEHVARSHGLALRDFDVGFLRQIVKVKNLARCVFKHNLWMINALVFHDHLPQMAAGVFFDAKRFALNDVFVANLARDFRKNRDGVRIPLHEHGTCLDLVVFLNFKNRTCWNLKLLEFAALGVEQRDFTVASQHNLFTLFVFYRTQTGKLDGASLLSAALIFFNGPLTNTTDMERPHRQLRTRFANALSCNDTDGHPFLHHRTG